MNIHLPAILMFTRGTRFWPIPKSSSQTCDICPRKVASVTNWCWSFPSNKNYLVGGIPTPLKIWKSIGIIIPNIWKVIKLYKIPWFQTTNQLLIQTALWRTFPVRSFAEKHTEQLAVRQSSNANLGDCWYLFILYNHLFITVIFPQIGCIPSILATKTCCKQFSYTPQISGLVISPFGYGSIPINTIFSGLFTSILTQLWLGVHGTVPGCHDPSPFWSSACFMNKHIPIASLKLTSTLPWVGGWTMSPLSFHQRKRLFSGSIFKGVFIWGWVKTYYYQF